MYVLAFLEVPHLQSKFAVAPMQQRVSDCDHEVNTHIFSRIY